MLPVNLVILGPNVYVHRAWQARVLTNPLPGVCLRSLVVPHAACAHFAVNVACSFHFGSSNLLEPVNHFEKNGTVRSGATPAFDVFTSIKSLILHDIMPGLQTTRDEADQVTADALSAIQSCNNASKLQKAI